ncbi:MAG: carbohydrate ABC transporter permease [Glycomyces artemisiae]|uniref:Carbohydrate ABC transporter membrane protein 2 (CUT1 family) n=1 Tax=Glycomyces artemisiae TaxID=1076443 RepID=A0A2T0UVW9_9ACTN|nr:carbohydrate ABC transporter permease [Glycomyces artemisiae]NUQ88573.1 carbohydrate ABC transporter permease [Glycomyces artemisiae]PRY61987.1 carbohydrate ABC transporter membrane protein 2 (CUT1 family) [Glycomyces artemisiae]
MSTGTTSPDTEAAPKPPTIGESRGDRLRRVLGSRLGSVLAIVIAAVWTVPTLGLFISSLRPEDDIRETGWWTIFSNPSFTLDTYNYVLYSTSQGGGLIRNLINTVVITIPGVLVPVAFAAMAAYALAWIDFRGRNLLYLAIFALQVVPLQLALIPLLSFFSQGLHIGSVTIMPAWELSGVETIVQVWIAHSIFGLPLAIFLLHNFMRELPADVMEAARIDGASHSQIFRQVVLPLVTPALASIGIFQFLWVWNDFLVGRTFGGGESTRPLTAVLGDMAGTWGFSWTRLPAAAFIAIIVPLVVFLLLQRYFVRGLLAGSVKG